MRLSRLERLSLANLFSLVLIFASKAEANQSGVSLGKLLMLPANGRLGWKGIPWNKRSSLLGHGVSCKEKDLYNLDTSRKWPNYECYNEEIETNYDWGQKNLSKVQLCISELS